MSRSSQLHFNAMYTALHIVELIHYHPGWMMDCKPPSDRHSKTWERMHPLIHFNEATTLRGANTGNSGKKTQGLAAEPSSEQLNLNFSQCSIIWRGAVWVIKYVQARIPGRLFSYLNALILLSTWQVKLELFLNLASWLCISSSRQYLNIPLPTQSLARLFPVWTSGELVPFGADRSVCWE